MESRRGQYPTCCFCLHVRTGSVLIAVWHLIGQVCAMLLIGSMILKGDNTTALAGETYIDVKHDASDYCVALVIIFCYFLITSMMIKGISNHQSRYMLPFFCLQLFDFFISCLTAIGLMSYYPSKDGDQFDYIQSKQIYISWKDQMPEVFDGNNQWIVLVVMVAVLFVMLFKAYCIACVWSCYKFIAVRELADSSHTAMMSEYDMDAEALLPKIPNYVDAMKIPSQKPPPYEE